MQGELRDRYGHPHRILVKDGNQFWMALDGYYGKNSTEEDFGGGKEHGVLSLIFFYILKLFVAYRGEVRDHRGRGMRLPLHIRRKYKIRIFTQKGNEK